MSPVTATRAIVSALCVAVLTLALAGCGAAETSRSLSGSSTTLPSPSAAAPVTRVCGVTVARGENAPVLYNVISYQGASITSATVGGTVDVRVSASCARGSRVRVRPRGAFTVRTLVRARDGLPVVVDLVPGKTPIGTLMAVQDGKTVGTLKLDLVSGASGSRASY